MSTPDQLKQDIDQGLAVDADQFLTFMLADEEYGVDILRVQEIRGWGAVTTIPNTPEYVEGVINLRGTIVPLINLRKRFDLELIEHGPTTVVVVLKAYCGNRERTMGIVVDAVSEVHAVRETEIKPAPEWSEVVNTNMLRGLATISDQLIILVDVDRLLCMDELVAAEANDKHAQAVAEASG